MKIETIDVKGVLAFPEHVSIDLRDLPPGLIAVCGRNGQGKTTTLEAAFGALYRSFPSRPDKALYDYATRADAYLETSFELDGRGLYRARVSLDSTHRTSMAVLSRVLPDGQTALLNDGKLTTFDAAVAEILPPASLLLASVFAAQTRAGSFVRLGRKERKQLFASLLGLDHYEMLSDRAKSAAALVQQGIDALLERRRYLARDGDESVEMEIQAAADALQVEALAADRRRVEVAGRLAEIEAAVKGLQADAIRYAEACAALERLRIDVAARMQDRVAATLQAEKHERDTQAERRRILEAAEADIAQIEAGMRSRQIVLAEQGAVENRRVAAHREANAQIRDLEHILAVESEIRAAAQIVEDCDARIEAAQDEIAQVSAAHAAALTDERGIQAELTRVDEAVRQLAESRRRAGLLSTVPCGGAGAFAACQFLADAAAAQASIPELEAIAAKREDVASRLLTCQSRQAELRGLQTTLAQAVRDARRERDEAAPLAERLPELTLASSRLAALEARKLEIDAQAARESAEAAARETERQRDLRERLVLRGTRRLEEQTACERLYVERRDTFRQTLADLAATIDRLSKELLGATARSESLREAKSQADALSGEQAHLQREATAAAADIARLQSEQRALEQRTARYRAVRAELADVDTHLEDLRRDLTHWTLLSKALGRDGLQVIEIDQAGPTVAAYANDLLSACFGSRFTVDLVTQEAKVTKGKDGSQFKDAFELKVFDAERGGEARDLSDLSGGEQVLVDEALKSAIALLVNERSPHPLRTCWRDETTGALDGENADRYIQMLRRVHQIGGFHHLIFITHNEDAKLQADAQIVVGGGAVRIEQPPYGASVEAA